MISNVHTDCRDEKRTLIYLCYGDLLHVREAKFSILTLINRCKDLVDKYRIVVYTDNVDEFADYPVTVEFLSSETLESWLGGGNYIHRRKIMTIIHALEKYASPLAFIDSDTWFKKSPAHIFKRIGPGRTCLHLSEGRIDQVPELRAWSEVAEKEPLHIFERETHMERNSRMWNSGVIGIHPEDGYLIRECLSMVDQMCIKYVKHCTDEQKFHTIEQMAMGYLFERYTRTNSSNDIVFHYWRNYLKAPFLKLFPDLVDARPGSDILLQAHSVYRRPPPPRGLRRLRILVTDLLHDLGLALHNLRASA